MGEVARGGGWFVVVSGWLVVMAWWLVMGEDWLVELSEVWQELRVGSFHRKY